MTASRRQIVRLVRLRILNVFCWSKGGGSEVQPQSIWTVFASRLRTATTSFWERFDEAVGFGNAGVHAAEELLDLVLNVGGFTFQRTDGGGVQVVL